MVCYKKIIIFFIIISFIFLLSCPILSYADSVYSDFQWYSQDPTYYITTEYDNICNKLVTTLDNCLRSDTLHYEDNKYIFDNQIINSINREKNSYYIEMIDYNSFYLYILDPDIPLHYSDGYTNIYVNDTFTTCPTVVANIDNNICYEIKFDTTDFSYVINDVSSYRLIHVPECLLFRKSQAFEDYCNSYENGTTLSVLNDIKNALTDDNNPNNIGFNVSSMKSYIEDENTQDIDTNFAKPSYDSSEFDLRVDMLFNHIEDVFTTPDTVEGTNIEFTILNKKLVLNSRMLYNWLSSSKGGPTLYLINLFWNFIVSLYIFKDLSSIINDLRNGDLLNKSDTNIKTDML